MSRIDAYVERLCAEIRAARLVAKQIGATLGRQADTVYFGGGTPSLLSAAQLRKIFVAVREHFDVAGDAEMTLECAPGQLSDDTLEELLRQGVNRISLGVQSFVDRESQAVGRLHTGAMCEAEIARLRGTGVRDIGVDLIAGLPHQTNTSWRESVERAVESGVTHVSMYLLEVDDESRLGREALAGGRRYGASALPPEDLAAALYESGCAMLEDGGIRQYEISNFAREGHQSRHNRKYWLRQPYIGFGLDAHSMLPIGDDAVRFQNTDNLEIYMGAENSSDLIVMFPRAEGSQKPEFIDRESAFEEWMFLGLRMNEGVDLAALRKKFGGVLVASVLPGITEAREAGLLMVDGDRIWLTARGRMASNEVFSRLLVPSTA
jgi:oxygen-independent coproporphyrinogen-3 oxidase